MAWLRKRGGGGGDVVGGGVGGGKTLFFFSTRHIRGFRLYGPLKAIGTLDLSIRMPDPVVETKVARGGMPLVRDWQFAQAHSAKLVEGCVTGPHMLSKRAWNEEYASDRELFVGVDTILNA